MTESTERVHRDDPSDDGIDDGGIDRRTLLRGAAAAGVGGTALGSLGGRVRAGGLPNAMTVTATRVPLRYRIAVSGEIAFGPNAGDTDRRVDASTVEGAVFNRGELDNYAFSGRITGFEIREGDGRVTVNGEAVDDPVGLPGLPNRVTVRGAGERIEYAFAVTGAVVEGPEADGGEVRDSTVRGIVDPTGVDDFRFSGDVRFGDPGSPLRVTLEFDSVPDGGDP